jgi:peptidoglycan/LPS O-acetylase OafA/YrhL
MVNLSSLLRGSNHYRSKASRDLEPTIDQFRERSRGRFITLDAMRGVAAISVMMFHYLFATSLHLFTQAYYAVDFFFA